MIAEVPEFLDIEDVLELHALLLARYGGADGIRDQGLLESALAQAQATFDGQYLHDDMFSMAAAYLFHLAQDHPLVDGNKRTALLAALVFLDLNGVPLLHCSEELYELTMGVAQGLVNKATAADTLRRIAQDQ